MIIFESLAPIFRLCNCIEGKLLHCNRDLFYQKVFQLYRSVEQSMRGSREKGAATPPPPWKSHKNIGFLSTTGPDHLKNHKTTKPAFDIGPAKRHLIGVSLAGRWWIAFSGIHLHLINEKKTQNNNVVRNEPLWQNFLDPRMQRTHQY